MFIFFLTVLNILANDVANAMKSCLVDQLCSVASRWQDASGITKQMNYFEVRILVKKFPHLPFEVQPDGFDNQHSFRVVAFICQFCEVNFPIRQRKRILKIQPNPEPSKFNFFVLWTSEAKHHNWRAPLTKNCSCYYI